MKDTSLKAYQNMTAKISLHGQMIMSQLPYLKTVKRDRFPWYATKGPLKPNVETIPGATCEEIAKHCQMTEIQVVRRMAQLKRAGLVEVSKEKFAYKMNNHTYYKSIWYAL